MKPIIKLIIICWIVVAIMMTIIVTIEIIIPMQTPIVEQELLPCQIKISEIRDEAIRNNGTVNSIENFDELWKIINDCSAQLEKKE